MTAVFNNIASNKGSITLTGGGDDDGIVVGRKTKYQIPKKLL